MFLTPEHAQLAAEARALCQEQRCLESSFDEVTDPDLIDAICWRLMAIQSQLNHIYQKAKRVSCPA